LKKIIKEKLLDLIYTDEEIAGELATRVTASRIFDEAVDNAINHKNAVSIFRIQDGDIIVVPSGISDADFASVAALIRPGINAGIIAADDVKVIRLL